MIMSKKVNEWVSYLKVMNSAEKYHSRWFFSSLALIKSFIYHFTLNHQQKKNIDWLNLNSNNSSPINLLNYISPNKTFRKKPDISLCQEEVITQWYPKKLQVRTTKPNFKDVNWFLRNSFRWFVWFMTIKFRKEF